MDERDEFDATVERLTHDLTANLVNGKIPVSEAVRAVDTFFDGVAHHRQLEAKAKVLGDLFSLEVVQELRKAAHRETTDERIWRLARRIVSEEGCVILNLRAEGQKPLWEVVKSHLPEGMADKAEKNVWIVALVLGLDGKSLLAEHLQRVWESAQ
jgi:hypothetical protein